MCLCVCVCVMALPFLMPSISSSLQHPSCPSTLPPMLLRPFLHPPRFFRPPSRKPFFTPRTILGMSRPLSNDPLLQPPPPSHVGDGLLAEPFFFRDDSLTNASASSADANQESSLGRMKLEEILWDHSFVRELPGDSIEGGPVRQGMVRQAKIISCLLDTEIGRELVGRVLLGLFKEAPKTRNMFYAMCRADYNKLLRSKDDEKQEGRIWPLCVAATGFPILTNFPETAYASSNVGPNVVYNEISAVLEFSVQLLYLGALLALLGIGSFLVVRQILIRRELETAAKDLQDRVRAGEATSVEYFELGAVMLRKKFFSVATKYLEQAIQKWDGDAQDLAQVYNALGFSYLSEEKVDKAILQYEKAVKLQPGYVVAWNNLGDAYEKKKDLPSAVKAYEQALLFDPNNRVARTCHDSLKERVDRLKGVPIKYD